MMNGQVSQGNQTGSALLQQPSWGNALQQSSWGNALQQPATPVSASTQSEQVGVYGLGTQGDGAIITVTTSSAEAPTAIVQAQAGTTPLTTPTSFHIEAWMIYVLAAILAVVVVGFLVSTFKDHNTDL